MSLICLILLFLISTSIDNVYITNIRWYYQSWAFVASTSGSYVFESCHGYPDYTAIDATWKAARAFGIISFILGIVMLVVASISACATSTGQAMLTHVWEAPAYILTAICQGLTLLLLSSNACNSDVLIGLGGRKLKPSVNVFSFSVSIALYSYYAYTIFHSCIQSYYLVPILTTAAKTLLNFGETCSMSTGAKFIVSATAFWVAAGVVSYNVFSRAIVKNKFYLFC